MIGFVGGRLNGARGRGCQRQFPSKSVGFNEYKNSAHVYLLLAVRRRRRCYLFSSDSRAGGAVPLAKVFCLVD